MAAIGRPTVMTVETIAKLEEAFLNAATDRQACLFAGINPATLYRYCEENPGFSERKEDLKKDVELCAKQNIIKAIKEGDKPLSQWYLDRKARDEFSTKQETEHSGSVAYEIIKFNDLKDANPVQLDAGTVATPLDAAIETIRDDSGSSKSPQDNDGSQQVDNRSDDNASDVLVHSPVLQSSEEDHLAGSGHVAEVLPTGDLGSTQ